MNTSWRSRDAAATPRTTNIDRRIDPNPRRARGGGSGNSPDREDGADQAPGLRAGVDLLAPCGLDILADVQVPAVDGLAILADAEILAPIADAEIPAPADADILTPIADAEIPAPAGVDVFASLLAPAVRQRAGVPACMCPRPTFNIPHDEEAGLNLA